jgi:hypothetical protein
MSTHDNKPKSTEPENKLGEMLTFLKDTKEGKYAPLENVILQEDREESLDLSECNDEECSYYYGVY